MREKIKLNKSGAIELNEAQITEQCIDYLRAHGWLCIRQQVGTFLSADGQRKIQIGEKGAPDWVVIKILERAVDFGCEGLCVCTVDFIEFKSLRGRLSLEQELEHERLRQLGYSVVVVRSLDDCKREFAS